MSTQRQEQASGKARQRRQLRERRFLILGIALLFLLGGAAMWILNSLVYWLRAPCHAR
jgi:hypothetical protein